jgi:hypothetical protein
MRGKKTHQQVDNNSLVDMKAGIVKWEQKKTHQRVITNSLVNMETGIIKWKGRTPTNSLVDMEAGIVKWEQRKHSYNLLVDLVALPLVVSIILKRKNIQKAQMMQAHYLGILSLSSPFRWPGSSKKCRKNPPMSRLQLVGGGGGKHEHWMWKPTKKQWNACT